MLGIDKNANLVVIELKRTDDGGHMELQAIRYAAMVSAMTFDRAVEVYAEYLSQIGSDLDARSSVLKFLESDEPDEEVFAQDVRIVLASAEFSKELTTAVMWLNDHELDIRCIRIKPYSDNGRILVDVQQIIPLPEVEDYQVSLKEKEGGRARRKSRRSLTKYDITIKGTTHERLSKRAAVFAVVRHLCRAGHSPDDIAAAVPWRKNVLFHCADGRLESTEFVAQKKADEQAGGQRFEQRRFYCGDGELIHHEGKTYSFTNQWGHRSIEAIMRLKEAFPDDDIECEPSE